MINDTLANTLLYSQSPQIYYNLLYKHKDDVMYAVDMLIKHNPYIISIKKIMDTNKQIDYPISAIYGSVLPIIYSSILINIGLTYNPFSKHTEPLKLIDYDTMNIKLLDDYVEIHNTAEFIKNKSFIIGYNNEKPVTRTLIQTSSINNLLCNCWDLNYTSAIIFFEEDKEPHIMRHPDFTEFLFGYLPLQVLSTKNNINLYDYTITERRKLKAYNTWY